MTQAGRIARLIDRTISVLAPGWGARRAFARYQIEAATYAAARTGRLERDWPKTPTSADGPILEDDHIITARARFAARDHWAASSTVDAYRRYIAGDGITPRAAGLDANGEPAEEWNQAIDRAFYEWARSTACDFERRKTLWGIQALIAGELATAGEVLVLTPYERRPYAVGLSIQLIEKEQFDTQRTQNTENGNEIRDGVEIDQYHRPVAYWIFTAGHPLETFQTNSERITADRAIHLLTQERIRQTHGVSRLTPVLSKLRNAAMYDDYTLIRAKMEACIGAVRQQSQSGDIAPLSVKPQNTTSTEAANELRMEPGMFPVLPPGETISWTPPTTPGTNYDAYTKSQLGMIGAGAGLDYITVSRDYSRTTYGGQRQAILDRDAALAPYQQTIIDLLLRLLWDRFCLLAVMERRIETPADFWQDPRRYLEADWQGPAKPWIDPAKQAAAVKLMREMGLVTDRDVLNELGYDWREIYRQRALEKRTRQALGIDDPPAARTSPAGPPAGQEDNEDEEARQTDGQRLEPDEDEALTDRIVEAVLCHAR